MIVFAQTFKFCAKIVLYSDHTKHLRKKLHI